MAHEVLVLRAGHVTDDSRSPGGHRRIEIVYETHSISVDNERGVATGWLDGELSERGREAAKELGARRRDDGIAVVYSSDLGRAVETAEIAFGGSGIPVRLDPRLRECNYGELNGMPSARLNKEVPAPDRHAVSRRRELPPGRRARARVPRRSPPDHDGARIAPRLARGAALGAPAPARRRAPLEDVVGAPFEWQPGWEFVLSR